MIKSVQVITPIEAGAKVKPKIEAFVKKKAGKGAQITYLIDKELVGGIVIKIGDNVYDGSIRRQLEKLQK